MTLWVERLRGTPPPAAELVSLCHDRDKKRVWLELTNSDWIMGGKGSTFVTVYIGAYRGVDHWHAMDAKAARWRDVTLSFGAKLGPSKAVADFQRAIVLDWANFDGRNPGQWAQRHFSRSVTPANFVMKALQTGFKAMGNAPAPGYGGLQAQGFLVDDAIDYLKRGAAAHASITVMDGGLFDFDELHPNPAHAMSEDHASPADPRNIPIIPTKRLHGGRNAYAAETAHIAFPRVNAYGFRGDSRPPSVVKNAGGFNPNYVRPDHIRKFAEKAQDQALNLGSFLQSQDYGGYISVSKSYAITKWFASGQGGTTAGGRGSTGWVYVCLVEGALEVPLVGTHSGVYVPNNEQELAMPGLLDWDDVMGCRKVDGKGKFEGNVFLRKSMGTHDLSAYKQIWDLLSGESQGPGLPAGF